jgi:exopolyphosphatase/guanosine-5'-triphosphate,3'-diphosphate pyrophosphatase
MNAIVSIGTNSTRVLLADLDETPPRLVFARSIGTRLGEGLRDRGRLGDEAMARTLAAVRTHERSINGRAENVVAIATSAVRRAENGVAFAAKVEKIVGAPLHVLSGDEEALASYRGAISALPLGNRNTGVLDTGGGSTEYAVGSGTIPERVASCEIGAVRLTETCPGLAGVDGAVEAPTLARARELARAMLAPMRDFPTIERLALVGGSATTAAALVRGDRTPFATAEIAHADVTGSLARLCAMPLRERKLLAGMNPQRADILPAGLIVLDAVFELTGMDRATATSSDLLMGYLLIRREGGI